MHGCTCRGLTLCVQCHQLAQRAGVLAPVEAPAVSEKVFQAAVLRIAREAGYTFAYHTYRSTKSMGGFPDLILCHQDAHREPGWPIWAVELKTDTGVVAQAQRAWLEALRGSRNVITRVWRPGDWPQIVADLTR